MPSVRTVVSGGNPARARTSGFCGPFVFSRAVEPTSERARRIAAAAEINGRLPRTTVVMLAAAGDDAQLFAALRAGAESATSRTNSSRLPHAIADALPAQLPSRARYVSARRRVPGTKARAVAASSRMSCRSRAASGSVLDSLRQKNLDCRDRGAAVRLAGDRAQPRRLAASQAPVADREAAVRLFDASSSR
jgi:hypothetical protein